MSASLNQTSTGKAVICQADGSTALVAQPRLHPQAGEILLKLNCVGLCGTDLFKLATMSETAGTVLGHELVGRVMETGGGVERFSSGDRVVVPHHVSCGECIFCQRGSDTMCPTFKENLMAPGGFADFIIIRPRAVAEVAFLVPDNVSDEQAVFVEPAACVLRGINKAETGRDSICVIFGAGSMGLLHLLVLKSLFTSTKTLVIDPDEHRRTIAASLGADCTAMPGRDAQDNINALTKGIGADIAFDTVGGNATLQAGISLTRPGGSIILFAHAAKGTLADFDLNSLFKHERRLIGTYSGAKAEQHAIFELICSGKLDASPLVTHHLPLDEFQYGVNLAIGQKALKVLFTPSRKEP